MFFDSNIFWFLMGIFFVLVVAGFRAYAKDRGWTLSWWKAALGIVWYAIFLLSFYAWGTLMGENEGEAGIKILLLGLFICLISGVGLWRLMAKKSRQSADK
jgi:hypothetical protein